MSSDVVSETGHPGSNARAVLAQLHRQIIGSTVVVIGEVDAYSASSFESILLETVDRGDIEELDLSGIGFFGSAGAEPLKHFSRLFSGRIVTSRPIDRVLGLLRIDLLTRS